MVRKDSDTETPWTRPSVPPWPGWQNEIAAGRAPHAANVPACSADTWDVITGIIADYGETLVQLPRPAGKHRSASGMASAGRSWLTYTRLGKGEVIW